MSNATGQASAVRPASEADAPALRSAHAEHHTTEQPGDPRPRLSPRQRDVLREAVLHEFSPTERLFLVLRWCERMTLAEIAAVMDMTELQAVRMQRLIVEMLGSIVPDSAAG